jgi:hypothetical protein
LKILSAKSPSESAKSAEYKVYQQDFPIYDGRCNVKKPVETTAPPTQLFHPVFGHFLDDLANDLPVPLTVAKATVRYICGLRRGYMTGKKIYGCTFLRILGMGVSRMANADRTSPGGWIEISLTGDTHESIAALLKEDKKDVGDGGYDSSTQAGLSMARYWAQLDVLKFLKCLSFLT